MSCNSQVGVITISDSDCFSLPPFWVKGSSRIYLFEFSASDAGIKKTPGEAVACQTEFACP